MQLSELIDITELKELCESFTAQSRAVTAILDLEGNILVATGWQDICTCFHRVHPLTAQRCRESDTVLAGQLRQGEEYNVYKCKNGLVDVAVPIIVEDEHIANFFTGQFFFEAPDREYFIRQAELFGFDKEAYIEALNRVPIFSEAQIRALMEFFSLLTRVIARMGLAQKRQKAVLAKLQESQQRLNFHVDNSPMAAIEWNSDFIVTRWAGEAEKIFGWTPYETVGKPIMDLRMVYEEDTPVVQNTMKQLAEGTAKYVVATNRNYTKDRRLITCEWYNTVLKNEQGQMISVLSQVLDITERKIAGDLLKEKQQQLEMLNTTLEQRVDTAVTELRIKDQLMIQQSKQAAMGEMINNIAHQWKQPLNSLGLIVQSMADGALDPGEIEPHSRLCLQLVDFMAQTIDDFRSFFRTDKGKSLVSMRQSIDRALIIMSASLKDSNISVTIEPGEEVQAVGYPNEYSQAILNLLANARDVLLERNTVRPAINVRIFTEAENAVVTVSDNGGGISPEAISQIFAPNFTTKEFTKGSGIGLFMSKIIIEQHMDGSLTAENIEGGACFRIEVPAAQPTETPISPVSTES